RMLQRILRLSTTALRPLLSSPNSSLKLGEEPKIAQRASSRLRRDNRRYAAPSTPCSAASARLEDCAAFLTESRCGLQRPRRRAERPSPAGSPTRATLPAPGEASAE